MDTYNEKSGVEVRAAFFDNLGEGTIPTTVHWNLECQTTKTHLAADTEVFPVIVQDDSGFVQSSVLVEVPGSLNAIQDQRNTREKKLLLIIANKDLATEFSAEFPYWVLNKQGRS